MSQNVQHIFGIAFALFLVVAAFAWLFEVVVFTWPMFLVWLLCGFLAIGFLGRK